MAGKDEKRAEGLAEQSLNTSIAQPGSNHKSVGKGGRKATANDQRKSLGRSDARNLEGK